MGSTVEQDRSISLNKLNTLENVADLLTKHVPRAVLDKLAGMMGYRFPDEESQKFQEQRMNRWRMMFTASCTKRLHLTTAVLRRCVELNILQQPHLHRPHGDLLSYVTVLRQCWESVGITRTDREV